MKDVNKAAITKYATSFGAGALITLIVCLIEYITGSGSLNLYQILSDGFNISGFILISAAILIYCSGEGIFLGIGFMARHVALTFMPMGRMKHETYATYRERTMNKKKKGSSIPPLLAGAVFLAIGIIFTVIWASTVQIPAV